jgi:formate hydrogenlyase transcriptional activator
MSRTKLSATWISASSCGPFAASVRRVMHCDGVDVSLLSSENSQLHSYALDLPEGRGFLQQGFSTPLDETSARSGVHVLRTGQSLCLRACDLSDSDHLKEIAVAEDLQSFCLLPLVGRTHALVILGLARREDKPFTQGEVDFLTDVAGQVAIAVENATIHQQITDLKDRLAQEKLYLEDEIRTELGFEQIVGKSAVLRRALRQVATVAPTESTVLIYGETGTGKELIARAIHDRSPRRARAFVKLNCAAIPTGLLESELFGHEKGAFTGGIAQRIGRFELTIILSTGPALHVPLPQLKQITRNGKPSSSRPHTLEEAERKHILAALEETHWVLAGPHGAAARLGLKRSTLQNRMRKLGISRASTDA